MANSDDIRVLVGRAAASLGYLELKPEQEEAVASFVRGADVFVSLPTGYGKSLCFGLLPRVFDLLRGVENRSIAVVVVFVVDEAHCVKKWYIYS